MQRMAKASCLRHFSLSERLRSASVHQQFLMKRLYFASARSTWIASTTLSSRPKRRSRVAERSASVLLPMSPANHGFVGRVLAPNDLTYPCVRIDAAMPLQPAWAGAEAGLFAARDVL